MDAVCRAWRDRWRLEMVETDGWSVTQRQKQGMGRGAAMSHAGKKGMVLFLEY